MVGSPFLSERARARAPQILSYAAVSGSALLVSPTGEIVMVSGAAIEVDLDELARRAMALGAARTHCSFKVATVCVHAHPITMGWVLCVVSTVAAQPGPMLERLRRASAVMAMALTDGGSPAGSGGGSSPSGAAGTVTVRRLRRG